MNQGVIPYSGIDTDARWGYSHTKGWVFGYKLHMISSTDSNVVSIAADVTTANVQDNQVYPVLTSSCLHPETIEKIYYMVADPGYDDRNLYDLDMQMEFQLVCPVRRYKTNSKERLQLTDFYGSVRTSDILKTKYVYRITD